MHFRGRRVAGMRVENLREHAGVLQGVPIFVAQKRSIETIRDERANRANLVGEILRGLPEDLQTS